MEITGLTSDRYLINNPIWVDITNIAAGVKYVSVSLSNARQAVQVASIPPIPVSLRLYPLNGRLYFDLSEGIKSFFSLPDFSRETPNDTPIGTNYETIFVRIQSTDGVRVYDSYTVSKTFIRGGRDGSLSNRFLSLSTILKESTKIPRWGFYPVRKFYMTASRDTRTTYHDIRSTTDIPYDEIDERRIIGCNPLYFKFLNTKGGYSNWLFEKWEYEKATDAGETIQNRNFNYSLGSETEHEIEVESRIERDYFETLRALVQSPEVYVYELEAKLYRDVVSGGQTFGTGGVALSRGGWYRVYPGKNKITFKSSEDVKDIKLKFEVPNLQRPTVKW